MKNLYKLPIILITILLSLFMIQCLPSQKEEKYEKVSRYHEMKTPFYEETELSIYTEDLDGKYTYTFSIPREFGIKYQLGQKILIKTKNTDELEWEICKENIVIKDRDKYGSIIANKEYLIYICNECSYRNVIIKKIY